MPLYKRKPFAVAEPPKDLNPSEAVFQVRFTKEIFRNYTDYLARINLYRQRVWTCKVTGKTNLTYEEALVSEHRASEKVQQIPKESVVPILQMVQYSTLTLKDLSNAIFTKFEGHLFEGMEMQGRKDQSVYPCKILKIMEDRGQVLYKVGWLDKEKKVVDSSTVDADCLIQKKPPFSRGVLKSFIRESTSQNAPWVVHKKLAQKYGLQSDPPEGLKHMIVDENGNKNGCKARNKMNVIDEGNEFDKKRKKTDQVSNPGLQKMKKAKNEENTKEEPILYPIDDLLVKPGPDDPVFADRPPPSRDFRVPADCVGDLLMVWDFCSSFSRVLNLWPFSLEDLEQSICHKDSGLILIIEVHSALLHLLVKDEGDYFMAVRKKKRKPKIMVTNWTEYLCDFLEVGNKPELSCHASTIKRGHYGLLDAHIKLGIFHELVAEALTTNAIRDKLDEYTGRKQDPAAAKREEARKKREEQNPNSEGSGPNEINNGEILPDGEQRLQVSKSEANHVQDKGGLPNGNKKDFQTNGSDVSNECGKLEVYSRKFPKILKASDSTIAENVNNPPKTEESKKKSQSKKEKDLEPQEKKNAELKKENIKRESEKQLIRTNSLGKDRSYNRYWFFRRDGRLFIESSDSKLWGYYSTKEELDAFMSSLNPKGERERSLQRQLEKHYSKISLSLQKRSKDVAQRILLEEAVLRRSTRVRAQPRDSPTMAFLRYTNKWKVD